MILDTFTGRLTDGELSVSLTSQQTIILSTLVESYPRPVAYDRMLRALHGVMEPENAMNSLQAQVCYLRSKLRRAGFPPLVGTVYGRGLVAEREIDLIDGGVAPARRTLVAGIPRHAQ